MDDATMLLSLSGLAIFGKAMKEQGIGPTMEKVSFIMKTVAENKDALVYGGLAYLGYTRLPRNIPIVLRLAWGPVGLKLAKTGNIGEASDVEFLGFKAKWPINSQMAGLSMLAALGFACLPWENVAKSIGEQVEGARSLSALIFEVEKLPLTEGERAELKRLGAVFVNSMLLTRAEYNSAYDDLNVYAKYLYSRYVK